MESIVFLLYCLWNDDKQKNIAYIQYKHNIFNVFGQLLFKSMFIKSLDMKDWMNTITQNVKFSDFSDIYYKPWLEQSGCFKANEARLICIFWWRMAEVLMLRGPK